MSFDNAFMIVNRKQLHKKGSMAAVLPPWSGIDISCDEKIKENQLEPDKKEQHISTREETGAVNENTGNEIKQLEITPEDLTYSNIADVQDTITTQQNLESQGHAVPLGGEQSNDVYEVVPPARSAPPPKPLPYSESKKSKSGSGTADHDGKIGETEKVCCFKDGIAAIGLLLFRLTAIQLQNRQPATWSLKKNDYKRVTGIAKDFFFCLYNGHLPFLSQKILL